MARKYSFLCLFGIFVLASILLSKSVIAQTHLREGEVSGEWTKGNSPYLIDGNISVAAGKKLIIRPGTTILFSGSFSMVVRGSINALGEKDAPIAFSFADTLKKSETSGWRGVKLYGTPLKKDTSMFVWCSIGYSNATGDKVENCRGGAIFADTYHYIELEHCTFHNNKAVTGGAIYARHSSLKIEGCRFERNRSFTDGGALCLVSCKLKMSNNIVLNNQAHSFGGGLLVQDMKAFFANNVVVENKAKFGAGIALLGDTSTLVNNTIAENHAIINGGGVHLEKSTSRFINTILWGNQSGSKEEQGYLFEGSNPRLWYCNVQKGCYKMGVFSRKTSSIDEDFNNIDKDPDFTRADTAFYGLSIGSPCIDYGIPDTSSLYLPKTDVAYKYRIKGRAIDIGAHEFGATVDGDSDKSKDDDNKDNDTKPKLRLTAYPNPSDGEFRVLVSNPEHKSLALLISNSSGNVLLKNPINKSDEVFILQVEIKDSPGIYMMIVTDEDGKMISRKKMIVTK